MVITICCCSTFINVILIMLLICILPMLKGNFTDIIYKQNIDKYFTETKCNVDYLKYMDTKDHSYCSRTIHYHFLEIGPNNMCLEFLEKYQHFIEINNQTVDRRIYNDKLYILIWSFTFIKPYNIDTVRIISYVSIAILLTIINLITLCSCYSHIWKSYYFMLVKDYNQCVICLDDINSFTLGKNTMLKCNHIFHNECINEWLKENDKCPTCIKFVKTYYNV